MSVSSIIQCCFSPPSLIKCHPRHAQKTSLRRKSQLNLVSFVKPSSPCFRCLSTSSAGDPAGIPSDKLAEEVDVAIIGSGLAGLSAAKELSKSGLRFVVLEKGDGVGGRVRTDKVDGFLLDRGFQIFLSAYPTAQDLLDYSALDLKPFYAGALVRFKGKFHRVADPFRHPVDGILSLLNPIGSVVDKVLVGIFRFKCVSKSLQEILESPETSIGDRLKVEGFSPEMVDRFFRPFLGGIFFDRQLTTTSRLLEFVLRMLALGSNMLPAGGIGAIPIQLAQSLPSNSIHLNSQVNSLTQQPDGKWKLSLSNGKAIIASKAALVAVEGPDADRLLSNYIAPPVRKTPRSTVCLYFASPVGDAPREPVLYLNGSETGIINNLCFPSAVSPSYAPEGKTLVSVSLIGQHIDKNEEELERAVRAELREWFGKESVDRWQHLKTYRIPFAQPDQTPPTNLRKETKIGKGLFVCGDHRDSATFDGALLSGKRAARAILDSLTSN